MSVSIVARDVEAVTIRRVSWRLMPFLLLAYLICYIDRANVGFAALQMNKAVGIDSKIYGLGAGIFFIGYFILEVPSSLALERFGARTWIARIMISWGAVSAAAGLAPINALGNLSGFVFNSLIGYIQAETGSFPWR
jgi:MFS transporter, ACS family, tartrate transporter